MAAADRIRRLFSGVRSANPIGLDHSGDALRFAQFQGQGSALWLRGMHRLRIGDDLQGYLEADPRANRRAIRRVLSEAGLRGHQVTTHAPTRDLRTMILTYSAEDPASEPMRILELARERMRSDLSDYVVDYISTRSANDSSHERSALVAALPEESAIRHIEGLRSVGLEVAGLEIAPAAIRRLVVQRIHGSEAETVLVLRVRHDTTQLMMLSGRRFLLFREVEVGRSAFDAAVAKSIECEADVASQLLSSYGFDRDASPLAEGEEAGPGIGEALRDSVRPVLRPIVEQIHKAISYTTFELRGVEIDRIFLLEEVSRVPGLDALLAEQLQLPVERFTPRFGPTGAEAGGNVSDFAMAFGLGLRGAIDV